MSTHAHARCKTSNPETPNAPNPIESNPHLVPSRPTGKTQQPPRRRRWGGGGCGTTHLGGREILVARAIVEIPHGALLRRPHSPPSHPHRSAAPPAPTSRRGRPAAPPPSYLGSGERRAPARGRKRRREGLDWMGFAQPWRGEEAAAPRRRAEEERERERDWYW